MMSRIRHDLPGVIALFALLALLTFTGLHVGSYVSRLRTLDVDPPAWMDSCSKVPETRATECNYQALLHQMATIEHNQEMKARMDREAFAWHHIASMLIFLAVLSGFVVSMYFAYVEFMRDRQAQAAPGADVFKAKFLGMEFNSSMIGLSILAMSFAFFLAYLKWVYPITTVGAPQDVGSTVSSASGPAVATYDPVKPGATP